MAHQTGIEASAELNETIAKALDGFYRMVQVYVDPDKELLVTNKVHEPMDSWENDFDRCVAPSLEDSTPCYIFYRMDERNESDSYLWILLSYTPDSSTVQQKMLLAATKATVKKTFTSNVVIDDVSCTTKEEMTLNGYRKHVAAAKAPPPLTREEQELKCLMEGEDHTDIGTTTRQSHLHGVMFPMDSKLIDNLHKFKDKEVQYLQLSIHMTEEIVLLESARNALSVADLPNVMSIDSPRYHLYRYDHSYEGDYQENVLFIYSNPGFKSTIKERMLYSSCKERLVSSIETDYEISVSKKIECDDVNDLTESFLMDQVHPSIQAYSRPKFNKPKPPARKGNKM